MNRSLPNGTWHQELPSVAAVDSVPVVQDCPGHHRIETRIGAGLRNAGRLISISPRRTVSLKS